MQPSDPRLLALIEAAPWKSTTYVSPHQYILKSWAPECWEAIYGVYRGHWAYNQEFMGRSYRYVDIGGYKYWFIWGSGPPGVNRAPLEG